MSDHIDPRPDRRRTQTRLDRERVVRPAELVSSSDFSVYDGVALRGWPAVTVSRGDVIFDRGEYPARHGRGRYLFRTPDGLAPSERP